MNSALLAMMLLGCSTDPDLAVNPVPTTIPSSSRGDVLLVVVDGLRADAPSQPAAEQALYNALQRQPDVRYSAAYTQSIAPYSGLVSLLTGRDSASIPVCALGWPEPDGAVKDAPWCATIPSSVPTLPEVLGHYSWKTALFTVRTPGAEYLSAHFHTAEKVAPLERGGGTSWPGIQDSLGSWWSAQGDSPRFATIVIQDMSLPERVDILAAQGVAVPWRLIQPLHVNRKSSEDWYRLYEEQARRVGLGLQGLLGRLDSTPTMFLTSTRGLNLGEATGSFSVDLSDIGGDILLDRTMRVPLAIFLPDSSRQTVTVTRPEELRSVLPTILGMAGAQLPAGVAAADLRARVDRPGATAFCEYGDMLALREGSWLLVFRNLLHGSSSLDPELTANLARAPLRSHFFTLHDVVSDPLQVQNLAPQQPQIVEKMKEKMLKRRQSSALAASSQMTPDRLWKLRMGTANGYW